VGGHPGVPGGLAGGHRAGGHRGASLEDAGAGPPSRPLHREPDPASQSLRELHSFAETTPSVSLTVTETDPYAPAPSPRDASSRRRISPNARDLTLVVPCTAQLPAGLFLKPLKFHISISLDALR
jgi:hypothetical protein